METFESTAKLDARGELLQIWLKSAHRGAMDEVSGASLVAGAGLRGNANQGGKRQVTLIETEAWSDMVKQLAAELSPSARRANLLVRGVRLENTRGRVLRVGPCRIRIEGETRPCDRMDQALPGLRAAMTPAWRGGAYGEVLDDGEISVGDPVYWETTESL